MPDQIDLFVQALADIRILLLQGQLKKEQREKILAALKAVVLDLERMGRQKNIA